MKTKLTENARRHIGESLTIRWGTSRGRDTYGYTTCSLRNNRGERIASCNGGGYDMRGTVIGHWIAATFPNELRAIKPEQMQEDSHWEANQNPRRICYDRACIAKRTVEYQDDDKHFHFPPETKECPYCHQETVPDNRDGKRVSDGRRLYGLVFSDPKYNPWDAKLERADGTFTDEKDIGKTLGQLKEEGKIVDLDAIRAWYKQTSPHATERHTRPSIDGACGESSVRKILEVIGLTLRKVADTSKLDVYIIEEYKP